MVDFLEDNRDFVSYFSGLFSCALFEAKIVENRQIVSDGIFSPNGGLVAEIVKWETKRHGVDESLHCLTVA